MQKQRQIPTLCRAARNSPPRRATSGQSLLELAFLTPLLLLLVIGSIEVGRYAYFSVAVGNAAHAGAAYASQNVRTAVDTANITAAACYDFNGTFNSSTGKCSGITVSQPQPPPCECNDLGKIQPDGANGSCTNSCPAGYTKVQLVQVTVTGTFTPIFSYPGIPQTFTVTRTATMRVN